MLNLWNYYLLIEIRFDHKNIRIKSLIDNKLKKDKKIMEKEKEIFLHGNKSDFESGNAKNLVDGCVARGISEEAANTIWNKMEKFAEYALTK